MNVHFHESSEDAYCKKIPRNGIVAFKEICVTSMSRSNGSLRHSIESKPISSGHVSPTFFNYRLNPKQNWGQDSNLAKQGFPCNKTWAFRKKTVRCECQRAKISQNLKLNLPEIWDITQKAKWLKVIGISNESTLQTDLSTCMVPKCFKNQTGNGSLGCQISSNSIDDWI